MFNLYGKLFFSFYRNNLIYQISNLNQAQKYSQGDIINLKIILSMANSNSFLEFSPITCNLPCILFERIPPWILPILTKWNSVSIGPQLKVGVLSIQTIT